MAPPVGQRFSTHQELDFVFLFYTHRGFFFSAAQVLGDANGRWERIEELV